MARTNKKKKNREQSNVIESVKKASKRVQQVEARMDEIVGVVFLATAAMVLIALLSFDKSDPVLTDITAKSTNLIGLVGAFTAHGLFYALGVSAFLVVVGLLYAACVAFGRQFIAFRITKLLGFLALLVQGTALFHILMQPAQPFGYAPGGICGEVVGGLSLSVLATIGSLLVLSTGVLLALIATTGFSVIRFIIWVAGTIRLGCIKTASGICVLLRFTTAYLHRAGNGLKLFIKDQANEFSQSLKGRTKSIKPMALQTAPEMEPAFISGIGIGEQTTSAAPAPKEPVVVTSETGSFDGAEPSQLEDPDTPAQTQEPLIEAEATKPQIVIPNHKNKSDETDKNPLDFLKPGVDYKNYRLPTLDMLESQEQPQVYDEGQLHEHARRLEQKLKDYGIDGHVTKIMPGPVVTMYEYAPGPGIKVAKIAGLSQDLALALEAMSVRIIAPIPGRAVVGIEVSNKHRQQVFAKEIIGNKTFAKSRSKLTMVLGKDIEGSAYIADLNKMPHLLVAGATGTGKSVALNCMIASILYKASPEDVRLIMVDPKVLELSLYEGIPHLLLPVVTDPRKAQAALQWAVNEMERRILILHGAGVRNLDSYNRKVEKQAKELVENPPAPETESDQPKRKKIMVVDKTSERISDELVEIEVDAESEEGQSEPRLEKMPHIVVVIDELADLMMTSGREVETNIARIAQKARAAGIHLIVATQRPSVNVITGLIKANLPARVSFRVASKVDSRTILDSNGAETLLGNGDMLFHPPTSSQLVRVHGAFISEEEITRIVEHLKKQAEPVYDESILASAEDPQDSTPEEEDHDEFYDSAVQIVAEMGQASTSMVQRKLRIGYNRAARLIERMEREGIVGPADGSRPRKVLIQNHSV